MSINNQPYILVFGASVVDIIGFSSSNYKPCDSTPGNIKISFGGVCRNIAENMARVGVNTKFISILGNDSKGRNMLEHSKLIGYDMSDSLILENGGTPTYMAILNENGEMVSAIADMKSIDEMNFEFINSKSDIITNAEFTCLDADDPENLEYILTKFKGKTKFILDPISATKAKNIRHLIKYFHTIKPNRHEAEVLAGFKINNDEDLKKAANYFLELGVKNVFISLDEDGIYYRNELKSGKIKACNVTVKNVTGAGDSFVAGLGYGYMKGMCIEETVKFAIAMSVITISHEETINPNMSYEFVEKTIESIDWTEIKY
ncbi:carbohydrate kinase family protein [Tepidibacter formicigenes]|jgi:sugar/nucleoside kinase (ribokinase family)|uniref:Sugar or nucleoside kinase, ribokinase family n=1 Tax=Tepidibacter formicigenes DSM 15518 TaxID=1123349 RepID=A0A1M6LCK7_9FIRM|nr:carbohydrate kinase family protein [Tepidibacter formicigenes]SHJ68906.1 Sugar or nucleoside kinase, ribokinase family [Tepidibacter formicigenes DSM 15518]